MAEHRNAEGVIVSDYPAPFSYRLLLPRFWLTWIGLGAVLLLTLLPARLRDQLGRWAGDLAWRRNRKRRDIVMLNLEWCFPERSAQEREAMGQSYFRLMARTLLDYGLLWWGGERRLDRLLSLEGEEHLRPLLEAGRPVILLTSHNLALDFGAAAFTRRFRSVGLINRARNPLLDWVIGSGRSRFKGILFRREEGLRPVVKAIRAGYAFYYLPDEDLGPENSVFVPFFGVSAATITALPRLARISRAAVVPFTTRYLPEEGRYVATLFAPLDHYPSGDDLADTARMNRELERLILTAPEQYMWSLRIFQTRPDGAPPPYKMKGREGSGYRPRDKAAG